MVEVSLRVVAAAWAVGLLVGGSGLAFAGPALAEDASPGSAASSTGTTWALRPSTADGPDGRVSLREVVAGGDETTDMVALTNFSDRPATFAVHASDGTISPDGNFDLIPADQESVGGGAWITIDTVEGATPREGGGVVLEVAAGATVVLPVQIRVPDNATPGDHPAGIVAELVRAESSGVQLTTRVGVRVHLRVSGAIVAQLAPEGVTATYSPSWNPFAPGTVTVQLSVSNAGNVRLGAGTVASLAGPFGIAPAQAETEQREVLPGEAAATTLEIPAWPLFRAWGTVVVTPAVVGEDDVTAALTESTASFALWAVPWSQLVLLAVIVGAVVLVRVLRRRGAARIQARIDAAVEAATAQALAEPRAVSDGTPVASDGTPVAAEREPEGSERVPEGSGPGSVAGHGSP